MVADCTQPTAAAQFASLPRAAMVQRSIFASVNFARSVAHADGLERSSAMVTNPDRRCLAIAHA
jgi:hypothetical protein